MTLLETLSLNIFKLNSENKGQRPPGVGKETGVWKKCMNSTKYYANIWMEINEMVCL